MVKDELDIVGVEEDFSLRQQIRNGEDVGD